MRVPVQAETLGLVTDEFNLWVDLAKRSRLEGMLCAIKDENLAIDTQSSNDIGVLRLIASLVNFSWMLNLVNDVAFESGDITRLAVAANLTPFFIIVCEFWRHSLGNLNMSNLEVIGAVIRRVSTEQKAMSSVVSILWFLDIGKPLDGQSRPSQGFSRRS